MNDLIWEREKLLLLREINSSAIRCVLLRFSPAMKDWFILSDIAQVSFSYDKSTSNKSTLPEIKLVVRDSDNPDGIVDTTYVQYHCDFNFNAIFTTFFVFKLVLLIVKLTKTCNLHCCQKMIFFVLIIQVMEMQWG